MDCQFGLKCLNIACVAFEVLRCVLDLNKKSPNKSIDVLAICSTAGKEWGVQGERIGLEVGCRLQTPHPAPFSSSPLTLSGASSLQ